MINAYALNDERILSHDFSEFDYGNEGLNSYIRDFSESLRYHNSNFNNTTVIMDDEADCEVAYITTRFNALIITEQEIKDLEEEDTVPVVPQSVRLKVPLIPKVLTEEVIVCPFRHRFRRSPLSRPQAEDSVTSFSRT